MIKISFSGISGSGKTSLLYEVKKILSLKYKVCSIEEVGNKNPFDDDKKSHFVSQFFYMSTQINEENVQAMTPSDFLLCDRSMLDQWVYWRSTILKKDMTPQLREKNNVLENMYRLWIKTYELVFLIRLDLNQLDARELDSEIRKIDADYIKEMENLYMETVEEDNLKIYEIWNNNTVDESAHEIIKIISQHMEAQSEPR